MPKNKAAATQRNCAAMNGRDVYKRQALRGIRMQLKDTLDKYNVQFWQTETCIMSNDEEIGGGGGYDRTMKTALYVARIIHHDIV